MRHIWCMWLHSLRNKSNKSNNNNNYWIVKTSKYLVQCTRNTLGRWDVVRCTDVFRDVFPVADRTRGGKFRAPCRLRYDIRYTSEVCLDDKWTQAGNTAECGCRDLPGTYLSSLYRLWTSWLRRPSDTLYKFGFSTSLHNTIYVTVTVTVTKVFIMRFLLKDRNCSTE